MDTRSYTVTPETIASAEALLSAHSIQADLSQRGGYVGQGWTIAWSYPEPSRLAVTLGDHPDGFMGKIGFWHEMGTVFGNPS